MGVEGNVHRIVVPTPLPMGATNIYLVLDEPITLIDTGPDTETTRMDLKAGLAEHGLAFRDIKRIMLTHGHVDHCGLAHEFKDLSDLEVLAHEMDRDIIEDFGAAIGKRFQAYEGLINSTGVPPQTLQFLHEFLDFLESFTRPCEVTRTLKDEDKIEFDNFTLDVIYTPGHSSGSASFHSGGLVFAGDSLLAENSPCAIFGGANKKTVGLDDFLDSLEKLSKLGAKEAYPGHGEPFGDVKGKIKEMRSMYEARRETILDYLGKEELTAFELMIRLFGNMSIEQVLTGMGDTLGHLEILVKEKAVEAKKKEGLTYYKA
jgi:glyoxylase-like metal-dependent hydrolase (beta-lactamase superfamily II)